MLKSIIKSFKDKQANKDCDSQLADDQAYFRMLDLSQDLTRLSKDKDLIQNLLNTINSLNALRLDGTFNASCLNQQITIIYKKGKLVSIDLV